MHFCLPPPPFLQFHSSHVPPPPTRGYINGLFYFDDVPKRLFSCEELNKEVHIYDPTVCPS